MAFTKIGQVIAVLAFVLGVLLMGYVLLTGFEPIMGTEVETGQEVMLFNPGEALMNGIKYVLFGVTLGVVTEISSAVNRTSRD